MVRLADVRCRSFLFIRGHSDGIGKSLPSAAWEHAVYRWFRLLVLFLLEPARSENTQGKVLGAHRCSLVLVGQIYFDLGVRCRVERDGLSGGFFTADANSAEKTEAWLELKSLVFERSCKKL